jgi:hypothetical protein
VAPDLDLWLGAEGGTAGARSAAAVGVGAVWTRRREPDSWLRLWLGGDGLHLLGGAETALVSRTPDAALTLGAAWVPHRLDAHGWRVSFDATTSASPPGAGTWRVRAAVAGGARPVRAAAAPPANASGRGGAGGVTFSLALGLERPWTGR